MVSIMSGTSDRLSPLKFGGEPGIFSHMSTFKHRKVAERTY